MDVSLRAHVLKEGGDAEGDRALGPSPDLPRSYLVQGLQQLLCPSR